MHRQATVICLLCFIFSVTPNGASGDRNVVVVKMITEKGKKLFVPDYVEVSVGDTVRFINVSGHHNTESMKSMIPEGASGWKSKTGKSFDLKITHQGVYAYRCTPHYRQAMVGLIVAGDPHVNLEKARQRNTVPKAAKVFDKLFARAAKKAPGRTPF